MSDPRDEACAKQAWETQHPPLQGPWNNMSAWLQNTLIEAARLAREAAKHPQFDPVAHAIKVLRTPRNDIETRFVYGAIADALEALRMAKEGSDV